MKGKKRLTGASILVKLRRLPHADGLPLPAYQTPDAAGFDLVAAVPADTPMLIRPGAHSLVPTGLSIELPRNYEAQVRPRSGLAAKHGITVLNSPGTIDADYRGEVQVLLINLGSEPFEIRRGERIAQMVVAPVTRVTLRETKQLSSTARGAGGFGSTGRSATPSRPKGKTKKAVAETAKRTKTKSPQRHSRAAR